MSSKTTYFCDVCKTGYDTDPRPVLRDGEYWLNEPHDRPASKKGISIIARDGNKPDLCHSHFMTELERLLRLPDGVLEHSLLVNRRYAIKFLQTQIKYLYMFGDTEAQFDRITRIIRKLDSRIALDIIDMFGGSVSSKVAFIVNHLSSVEDYPTTALCDLNISSMRLLEITDEYMINSLDIMIKYP